MQASSSRISCCQWLTVCCVMDTSKVCHHLCVVCCVLVVCVYGTVVQDAVMQQFFGLIGTLLASNPASKQRRLGLRTYRSVVCLTQMLCLSKATRTTGV